LSALCDCMTQQVTRSVVAADESVDDVLLPTFIVQQAAVNRSITYWVLATFVGYDAMALHCNRAVD